MKCWKSFNLTHGRNRHPTGQYSTPLTHGSSHEWQCVLQRSPNARKFMIDQRSDVHSRTIARPHPFSKLSSPSLHTYSSVKRVSWTRHDLHVKPRSAAIRSAAPIRFKVEKLSLNLCFALTNGVRFVLNSDGTFEKHHSSRCRWLASWGGPVACDSKPTVDAHTS